MHAITTPNGRPHASRARARQRAHSCEEDPGREHRAQERHSEGRRARERVHRHGTAELD